MIVFSYIFLPIIHLPATTKKYKKMFYFHKQINYLRRKIPKEGILTQSEIVLSMSHPLFCSNVNYIKKGVVRIDLCVRIPSFGIFLLK